MAERSGLSGLGLSAEALEGLRQLGGDRAIAELLQIYREHTPARIRRLKHAVRQGNREEVVKAAHSLKSGSLTIGASVAAERAGGVERAARDGRMGDVRRQIAPLESEVLQLLTGIEGAIREIRLDLDGR